MTLNITVTTPRFIYQSADYRLFDCNSNTVFDFKTQKIFIKNTFKWTASICFAGIGKTGSIDVSEWLSKRLDSIQMDDTFDRLIEELLKADSWLSSISDPVKRRHSFSIGAFVESKPLFALISNFEELPKGVPAPLASQKLKAFSIQPTKPKTYCSGISLTRQERKYLAGLAKGDPNPPIMYSALAKINRDVSNRSSFVSPACFTTHLRNTGEGGAKSHGTDKGTSLPSFFSIPKDARTQIQQLIDQKFGPGKYNFDSIPDVAGFVRMNPSDEYFAIQLQEKPQDPSVHSNYGAFLKDKKGDLKGAEREYRKAIELDGNHVNALGNLANLLWEKGDIDTAKTLYDKALEIDPGKENFSWNYARFLVNKLNNLTSACDVLDRGIANHPKSGRLHLYRAELSLLIGTASEALEGFRRAREWGADQTKTEAGYAFALHVNNGEIDECIDAYRTAISLNPKNGWLRLNLAQLLFIKGYDSDGKGQLREAMKCSLTDSAQLLAQFYFLAHTPENSKEVFKKIKSLLARGACLRWNVQPNIRVVSQGVPQKAKLLEDVSQVMAGEKDLVILDNVISQWTKT